MHIKKGDTVKVITGAYKGKKGVVLRAIPTDGKVIVNGINVRKKHVRARGDKPGQMVEKPLPIAASNVKKA